MANPSDQRGCGDAPRPAVRRRPAGCERSPRNRREESGRVRRRRSAHCARPRGGAPTNESHTMTPLIAKQHQARIGILPSRRTNDPEQNPEGTADGAGAPAVDPPKFRKGQHNSSSGRRSIGAPEPGDPPTAAGCPRKTPGETARRAAGPPRRKNPRARSLWASPWTAIARHATGPACMSCIASGAVESRQDRETIIAWQIHPTSAGAGTTNGQPSDRAGARVSTRRETAERRAAASGDGAARIVAAGRRGAPAKKASREPAPT
jgi:hypothetical protein